MTTYLTHSLYFMILSVMWATCALTTGNGFIVKTILYALAIFFARAASNEWVWHWRDRSWISEGESDA